MGESSSGFGGPNPIGGPSGAGDQGQQPPPASPPPTPTPTPAPPPQWPDSGSGQPPSWPAPGPTPQAQQWSTPSPPQWPTAGQQYDQPAAPGQYPQQQPWAPAGYGPPPPPKSRKPLYLILGAVGTVVVLVVAAVLLFGGSSDSGASSPSDAVREYFEALARGDAQAALALGESQPPDTTFLTDDILKKQIELSPITNIKTLGETPGANGAVMVAVSVDMGGKTSSDKIPASKVDGGWKVPHAAMTMDLGRNRGIVKPELFDVVTIFGEPAPKSGTAYVFPGPVELGSSNPNISVTSREFSIPGLMQIYLGLSQQSPEFGISDSGKKAITDAIMTKVTECTKSRQLAPPDCPVGTEVSGLIDGTAQWTAPTNLDSVSADFLNPQTGLVGFFGSASFGLRVQTDRGNLYETTITEFLSGEADIMEDPPTVTYER